MQSTNRCVVVRRHPDGALVPSDFEILERDLPEPGEGQFLVRALFVSVDPMLRLFLDPKPFGGGMPPLPPGTTVPGAAVGRVVRSRHPGFAEGEIVEGRLGWQEYALSDGAGLRRVGDALGGPENALGIGGLPGFTAYVGLHAAGGIRPGQTVLVSGAAGAVGSVVGPLVRARGGRAVGIAGGAEKCRYLLEEAGYDAVADRRAPDFRAQLAAALPAGIDLYFDNVGGPMMADMMAFMARGSMVLVSGLMSHYQHDAPGTVDRLPEVLDAVMFRGVRIQGFTQLGQEALRPAFEAEVGGLLRDGRLKPALHVEEGLDRLPQAMVNLFDKSVAGKVVVRIAG